MTRENVFPSEFELDPPLCADDLPRDLFTSFLPLLVCANRVFFLPESSDDGEIGEDGERRERLLSVVGSGLEECIVARLKESSTFR